MEIIIRAFRATDEPASCRRYIEGHQKVLEAYGVTKITSAKYGWLDDPHTYVIIAESPDQQKTYGGGRIQLHSAERPMPLESAIAVLDTRIHPYLEKLGDLKVAEFCGLWNMKEVAGYGIGSIFLGRIGVAITTQILGLNNLMALCSPATLRNCLKVGFQIIRELGNNGTLYYPKEDLIATPLIIEDLRGLPLANETERNAIWDLRDRPTQHSTESGPKGNMTINFDITLPQ
ncbi:hypothetical protein ACTHGU_16665 [Chitinophagaceae bacterium MMS25-I14]